MDRRADGLQYIVKVNRPDGSNLSLWYFHAWSQDEAVQFVRERVAAKPLKDGQDAVLYRSGEADPIKWKR